MHLSVSVRITHWIHAVSFLGLLASGFAILLAHPRLYWGQYGVAGARSLLDLPLPFVLTGQTGWGRSLHFLSAWITVFNGLVYAISGIWSGHFRSNLFPSKPGTVFSEIWQRRKRNEQGVYTYNPLQSFTYGIVIFVLFPLAVWSGLGMSPALVSAFPAICGMFGGHQSARTIHFTTAALLVLFLFGHVAMVCLTGFVTHMRLILRGGEKWIKDSHDGA